MKTHNIEAQYFDIKKRLFFIMWTFLKQLKCPNVNLETSPNNKNIIKM